MRSIRLKPFIWWALPALLFILCSLVYTGWFQQDVQPELSSRQFSEETLVDQLLALRLDERIHRVSWHYDILSIDFQIGESEQAMASVLEDIGEIGDFAFSETDNIKQILVRVLSAPSAKNLLLAIDAQRSNWMVVNRNQTSTQLWLKQLQQQSKMTMTRQAVDRYQLLQS
ncbi:hypothetical protein [Marinicrinis sediminis]|uniref:Uncharacterized protein n=1 Tax=Marinicrinis sediminis TaxID=1652465 RepID=A0ABW5RDS8_9BACL